MSQRTLSCEPVQETRVSGGATVAGVAAITLWSTSGVSYAVGMDAIDIMPYLSLTSALGVLTVVTMKLLLAQSLTSLFVLPRRVFGIGLLGVTLYLFLLDTGLGKADERYKAQVMLLNYLWPVWMVLLSIALLGRTRHARYAVVGALLGFVGVVIARGQQLLTEPPATYWPHAMTFVAGFLWALYSVLLRRWRVPAEQGGSTIQFAIVAILAALIATAQHKWGGLRHISPIAIALVVFGGIGPIGLAYYWWEIAVKRGNVHLMAVLSYFIPIISTALIALVYRQSMSPLLLPGAALIALGAYIGRRAAPDD